MALKKETLKVIAGILKVTETELETAIKDEKEVDFTIDDKLQSFTDPELQTLKSNSYTDGKNAGVEIAIKDAREKHGLEFTGKTLDGLLDAHKAKVVKDAKISPDQKVQELEQKISKMQQTIQEQETKITEKDTEVSTIRTHGELYKYIPEPGEEGPALGKDEVIQLMKANGYDFKNENGAFKASKGGQLLTDKLGNPLPLKEVVSGFITEKKLGGTPATPGGRGEGDKKPSAKAMKLSELKKQFTDEGKNLNGQEFMKAAQEAAKDKDFDMNA